MTTHLSGLTRGHNPYGLQNANHQDDAYPRHPLHCVTDYSAPDSGGGPVSPDIDPAFLSPTPRPHSRGGHRARRLNSETWLRPYPRRARPGRVALENLVITNRPWLLPLGPAEENPTIADPRAEHRTIAWQPSSGVPSRWDQDHHHDRYHVESVSPYVIAGGRSPMDCAARIDRRFRSCSPTTNSDAGRSTPERGHRDDESLCDLAAHWDPFWPRRSGGGSPRSPLRDEDRYTPIQEDVEAETEEEESDSVREENSDVAVEANGYSHVNHFSSTL
ncbi:hypothetical protein F4678DRAFT_439676 [Xylaria arbuscula]|nr:hypothetical protein F4678DRAFT_439676 [Xylaria arbuscula]